MRILENKIYIYFHDNYYVFGIKLLVFIIILYKCVNVKYLWKLCFIIYYLNKIQKGSKQILQSIANIVEEYSSFCNLYLVVLSN